MFVFARFKAFWSSDGHNECFGADPVLVNRNVGQFEGLWGSCSIFVRVVFAEVSNAVVCSQDACLLLSFSLSVSELSLCDIVYIRKK